MVGPLDLQKFPVRQHMKKYAHIINPVYTVPEQDYSSLALAQPITFASLQSARNQISDTNLVEILAVGFPEDASVIPSDFTVTRPLERSVLDLADFEVKRKLPILRDILEIALASSDAEYFIYTNIDIGVVPSFYEAINTIVERGYDAFSVNRRTVPAFTTNVDDLALIQSFAGELHPGHDCFVFHRDILSDLTLHDTCVGARFLVPPFLANLVCRAKKFERFSQFHLTFHIGDDRVWNDQRFDDYTEFNASEATRTFQSLNSDNLLRPSPMFKYWMQLFLPDIRPPAGKSVHVPLWQED